MSRWAQLAYRQLFDYLVDVAKSVLASPKQSRHLIGKEGWYPYYAGFSAAFARSALRRYPPIADKPVLDPWNGSGTTTQVCSELGLHSVGCDINPAMIVVAKARRLQSTVKESISPLAAELLKAKTAICPNATAEADPLSHWLIPRSVAFIRSIEASIRNHFIPHSQPQAISEIVCSEQFSDLAAYFYLILFRAVRQLLSPFKTANPTWIRVPDASRRLRPSKDDVENAFRSAVKATLINISDTDVLRSDDTRSELLLEDSRRLPLQDGSVGGIITSPPYLTRLDYVVATGVELAVLGHTKDATRRLRERMIGTTAITTDQEIAPTLKGHAAWCLRKIAAHTSKASISYYHKNVAQYLRGLTSSLAEATRVLAPSGLMAVVVQDSYYKDVHLDLPKIIQEYGTYNGMSLVDTHPFLVERHLGCVHPHHRKHCKLARVETVVVMQKQTTEKRYAH